MASAHEEDILGKAYDSRLMKRLLPVFRPVLDGVTFTGNPFDPTAPDGAGEISTMFGNAATECTLYMAANMANFSLDRAEV